MQIYFVRHGKTEWNLESRFQGAHGDSPLLAQSLIDIDKLGQYLKKVKFQKIYSSPLNRAFNTAQRLDQAMNANLPVIVDERLREFDLGKLEGMQFTAAQGKYAKEIDNLWHHPDQYDAKAVGGESYQEVMARGKNFAEEKAREFTNKSAKILVVSHGAALSAFIGSLLGDPLQDVRKRGSLANTGLTIMETLDQGKTFHVILWDETSFLGRKLSATDQL